MVGDVGMGKILARVWSRGGICVFNAGLTSLGVRSVAERKARARGRIRSGVGGELFTKK